MTSCCGECTCFENPTLPFLKGLLTGGSAFSRSLGARIRFFDSTPSGRILNRFSKDISSIDQEAAPILLYLLQSILSCLVSLLSQSFLSLSSC